MSKISFLFKRIIHMDYGKFFRTINEIHEKSNKSRIFLFFDIIYCGIRFQAGYIDYKLLEMYNLNNDERKTYITRGISNKYVKKYNQKEYMHLFSNKDEFNEKFKNFIKRDWIVLTDKNADEFNKFIKNKKIIIAKPINGTHGHGVKKIKPDQNTYQQLINEKLLLVEEVVEQIKELNDLNPSSVNTIRVLSLYKEGETHIIATHLRIGNKGDVDNFNGGGMLTPINLETGIVEFPALDKNGNIYEIHPTTGKKIKGFKIPQFNELKEFVKEAGKVVPQIRYVAWDVAISKNGPCLIEGNEFPGHDIYFLPPHRKSTYGDLPEFQKILGK